MLPLTELGQGRQGQPNGGGVKWSEMGKAALCWDGESKVYHSHMKCSYLPRGAYTDYGVMASYPSKQPNKSDSQPEKQSTRSCSPKEWEVCMQTP